MRRLFLAIAIGLGLLISFTKCEQAPAKPLHEIELTDDNGVKFKAIIEENSYIPRSINPNV